MSHSINNRGLLLAVAIAVSLALGGCAATPESPEGAAEVRNELNALKNDPNLANRTRVELRAAEQAVELAEQPLPADQADLGEHRVYMAERKVEIAKARATALHAEAQRERLSQERDEARLAARTSEVERAREETRTARQEAEAARESETASAAASAAEAQRMAEEMQQEMDDLKAEVTDRGLVLTLGDVLFATGSADLQSGANANLDKLVTFLNEHPERKVLVEGHTDNVGGGELNQRLSQQRAEAVRNYLREKGIAAERLSAEGIGMDRPVADNSTSTGRQQNRRVEIIIGNTQSAPAAGSR